MQFKIEKNIPAPEVAQRIEYPFNVLDVGDSFAIPDGLQSRASAAASRYGKRHDKNFTIRKHDDAYRCWRVA